MRRVGLVVAVLALAGCGGAGKHPAASKPPHLPRALARAWAAEADTVARALAAGDGCGALRQATRLRSDVVLALNRHQVPVRFQATLTSAVDELSNRIVCNPPQPTDESPPPPGDGHHHDHGPGHGHGHGKGDH
jgi:hypothetical protein